MSNPFYLILTTYPSGETGTSDPQWTLDDAADALGEAQKFTWSRQRVLRIDSLDGGAAVSVTDKVQAVIAARMAGRAA
jgi:hypothetical protein